MLPGISGFQWDAGHVIFLGLFFSVVAVIAATIVAAARRTAKGLGVGKAAAIRWKASFADLPELAKRCRHELAGEARDRVCTTGFQCGRCDEHAKFMQLRSATPEPQAPRNGVIHGFWMPPDRFYHRGHAWARPEADGTVTVGLDDFGERLIGMPECVELPPPGSMLRAYDTGWRAVRKGVTIRILSPVDGVVIATGGKKQGWYLRLQAARDGVDLRHLLTGREIQPWLVREMERLSRFLSAAGVGPSLADGGTPVDDFPKACPKADWDDIWGEMFLEP